MSIASSLPKGRARTFRILVVEDDPEMGRWVEEVLEEDGYETESARDALAGITWLLSGEFDAIVTDWKMPGLDGMYLLRSAERFAPDTPVVLVTAYAEVGLRERVRDLGAVSLLEKPFRREELLLHVRNALRAGPAGS